jgi:hypothetical protein
MEGASDAPEGAKNTLARKHVMIDRTYNMSKWIGTIDDKEIFGMAILHDLACHLHIWKIVVVWSMWRDSPTGRCD